MHARRDPQKRILKDRSSFMRICSFKEVLLCRSVKLSSLRGSLLEYYLDFDFYFESSTNINFNEETNIDGELEASLKDLIQTAEMHPHLFQVRREKKKLITALVLIVGDSH